ncbi:uncharacterized protein [Solanum lycopersicum]|uniref:uncharacterized protein n=1 Tax=Solanum lycopersicum TaxID=4081 RepID=UPI0037487A93
MGDPVPLVPPPMNDGDMREAFLTLAKTMTSKANVITFKVQDMMAQVNREIEPRLPKHANTVASRLGDLTRMNPPIFFSITNKKNQWVQAPLNANDGPEAPRVRDFVSINPLEFFGLGTGEDPLNFSEEIKNIFKVMQVTGNDRIELATYQLKDVSHIWHTQLNKNRVTNATPITLECLSETFLDRFFPIELREGKAQEFMNQGNMNVQEYGLTFNQLSRYAPHIVVDSRAQMNKFLCGMSDLACQDQEGSPDMVTNMFRVFDHDVYALLDRVLAVIEFLKVFPEDLLVVPPEREIIFGIDLLADTHPISVPP